MEFERQLPSILSKAYSQVSSQEFHQDVETGILCSRRRSLSQHFLTNLEKNINQVTTRHFPSRPAKQESALSFGLVPFNKSSKSVSPLKLLWRHAKSWRKTVHSWPKSKNSMQFKCLHYLAYYFTPNFFFLLQYYSIDSVIHCFPCYMSKLM